MGRLTGKTIVITGGFGLIGMAFVRGVVDEGGSVIVADLDVNRITSSKYEIGGSGNEGSVSYVDFDICSQDSIAEFIASTVVSNGRIDALVNAAYPRNKSFGARFEDVEYESFCENVNLHLGGYFLTTQKFAEYFATVGSGNVVTIASIYGLVAPRFDVYEGTDMTCSIEYSAIKSGLIHMSRYLAHYYKGKNVRFNCISPGGIFDNQPQSFVDAYNSYGMTKGMLNSQDLVGALVFLLSDESAFVNGQNLVVDDGWTL